MKKRIFRHATQTGAKLLFSILALLLVLTGCNVPTPTPPAESETTGTEQPTESPTEQPTEHPTEQPTEEVTTAPDVEVRYDHFLALLEKSYTEKQEFIAEPYIQDIALSACFTIPVVVDNGQIHLFGYLYNCGYVENLEFEYSSLMFEDADDAMQQMLNKIRNQKEYYVLECEERGQVFIVCEVENSIYFLSVFDEAWVVRSHMVCFE